MSKFPTLLKLAKKGDTHKLIPLLEEGNININQVDSKSGQGLIHIAIQQQDQELFTAIASQPGVNLELVSKQDETPLDTGVRLNNTWVVARLLDSHVNFRRKNSAGQTVLHSALRNQTHKDILKKLTANKIDINEPLQKYGSYFNLSIEAGHSDNFYFLLQELPVDYTRKFDSDGNTCLMLAAKKNKGDFVMAILNKLKDDPLLTNLDKQFFINHQNNQGNTALHQAAIKDKQTISQILEKYGKELGLDPTLKNKKGTTVEQIRNNQEKERVLEMQMEKRKQEEKVVRKLQKNEEKKRQRDEEERQRLEQIRRKKEDEKLMKIEAKVKSQTQKKKTAWAIFILLAIALGGMYLAFTNAIEKKKPVTL